MSAERRLLTTEEVTTGLAAEGLGWELADGQLVKVVRLGDFAAALALVNRIGEAAERVNHHPDIAISWNTVTLSLSTHDAGGITRADLDLAGTIDGLV